MRVERIVVNISTGHIAAGRAFYRDAPGLDIIMDHGWIATYGLPESMSAQLSLATQGGSETPVPRCARIEPR